MSRVFVVGAIVHLACFFLMGAGAYTSWAWVTTPQQSSAEAVTKYNLFQVCITVADAIQCTSYEALGWCAGQMTRILFARGTLIISGFTFLCASLAGFVLAMRNTVPRLHSLLTTTRFAKTIMHSVASIVGTGGALVAAICETLLYSTAPDGCGTRMSTNPYAVPGPGLIGLWIAVALSLTATLSVHFCVHQSDGAPANADQPLASGGASTTKDCDVEHALVHTPAAALS